MILIYIVCKNKIEATKIGLALLNKKLIACYNCWSINSAYFWQGRQKKDVEVVLLLKTRKEKYNIIESWVKKWHSYQIPCIFSIKPDRIEKNYLKWLFEETK